jgi:predicted dehydrogenase
MQDTTREAVLPRLRVAIIGGGMIAAVHRRSALLAGAEIVGVLVSNTQRSQETAREWQIAAGYPDLEALLEGPAEVVHVCSPNATHAPYVQAILAAGKHVVCEKPLGISLDEAEVMQRMADRAGVVATVPFVYRYHPVIREIRARVQAGEYGTWSVMHGHYLQDWLLSPGASNWRVDPEVGGTSRAFADIGSHWCDLVEWVSGQRLASVVAQLSIAVTERVSATGPTFSAPSSGELSPVSTEDTATLLFRTDGGVPGSLVVSQVSAGRKNRLWFELDGAAGSVSFEQEQAEQFWSGTEDGSHSYVRDSAAGSAEQRRLSYLPAGHAQGYGDCFAAFVADTYAAVTGEAPLGLPTFTDGLRSAQIVDAVVRSAQASQWAEV